MTRKKRVLFHSDFALAKTGFGRVMKTLLSELFKTGKYEIFHYCCGMREGDPSLDNTPWKSIGSLPSRDEDLSELAKDPGAARAAGYGSYSIDKVVKEVKPDAYIGVQDWWGVDYVVDKKWFKNINSALWITLDSLPILKSAKDNAHKVKNFWVWSNFAEKAMREEGIDHIKTVHGPIEAKHFYKLQDSERKALRKKFNLPQDAFIVGFVFRNQLRKLVPNVIEGYKLWKNQNPQIKNTYLLLHTNFSEGWNIKDQADLCGVDTKEILTTYVCRNCREYEVKSFDDRGDKWERDEEGNVALDEAGKKIEKTLDPQNKDCPACQAKGAQVTTGVSFGVSEKELNEVYNLMDVYLHALTSGGQEIPIQEAKLTELITLVTDYSCGSEMCEAPAKSLPLEWAKYLEHGTEFIKASTYPSSIAKQLNKFCKMKEKDKAEWGKEAREWVLENFSIEKSLPFFEEFIDASNLINEEDHILFESEDEKPDHAAEVEQIEDGKQWISELYKKILDKEVGDSDSGHRYWMSELAKGTDRKKIEQYFRHVAFKICQERNEKNRNVLEEIKAKIKESEESFSKNGAILYAMPQYEIDCIYSLPILKKLKEIYGGTEKNYSVFVATDPKMFGIFEPFKGELFDELLEFKKEMNNQLEMEKIFKVSFNPYINTHFFQNYGHNGEVDTKNL